MLLGLTGGYCAGKNAVASILEKRGWACIDEDALGHEAIEIAREAIVARFGPGVLRPDGRVDRRAMARIVFADSAALADQEAIIHPIALRLTDERIAVARAEAQAANREPLICLNAALLYRMPQASRCDAIIEVRASLFLRVRRARERDNLGALQAMKRIRRQRSLWRLRGSVKRPVVFLGNSGGLESLGSATSRALDRAQRTAELIPEPTPM